jgi:hypothetical protein
MSAPGLAPAGSPEELSAKEATARPPPRAPGRSRNKGLTVVMPTTTSEGGAVELAPLSSGKAQPASTRRLSLKRRRKNNVQGFSALSSSGASGQAALPSALARTRRVLWKRTKRRAFFLLEKGSTPTRWTGRIRALIIIIVSIGVAGVILETMGNDVRTVGWREAVRVTGFVTEAISAFVQLIDLSFRLWACTVNASLSQRAVSVPWVWIIPDRGECFCSRTPPPDAVVLDEFGKPTVSLENEHVASPLVTQPLKRRRSFVRSSEDGELPRQCTFRPQARLQYLANPWTLIELSTFLPMLVWIFNPSSPLDVFGQRASSHAMRLLRLFRILTLRRMFPGIRVLLRVIEDKRRELGAALVMATVVALITAAIVYELERPKGARTEFTTLTGAAYWSAIS